jgi:hypothetical protein
MNATPVLTSQVACYEKRESHLHKPPDGIERFVLGFNASHLILQSRAGRDTSLSTTPNDGAPNQPPTAKKENTSDTVQKKPHTPTRNALQRALHYYLIFPFLYLAVALYLRTCFALSHTHAD